MKMKPRIISGKRTAEDILRSYYKKLQEGSGDDDLDITDPNIPPQPTSLESFLELKDIRCVDADDTVFEEYPVLHVRKDIDRDADGKQLNFTPYQGAVHFESKGLFLPSTALTCNILAYLFQHKGDAEVKQVLDQYKDKGTGTGWHAQNTLVRWNQGSGKVIHYPHDADFPNNGGTNNINQGRRHTNLSFVVNNFGDVLLEEALRRPKFKRFIRHYTGLEDPSVLVEIGKEFNKPAKVWVPNNPSDVNYTSAVWVGCDSDDFILSTGNYLNGSDAARGVCEP